MQVAVDKLRRASECLKEISPTVADFVCQFTRSIVARKDGENPDFYTSSSCNAYIGRIVLINPHLAFVDESALIDSLVHESIHSLLWRCEVLSPFIADTSQVKGTTHSPWTQSELHLYTFLQACFVWYGLLTFWKLSETTRIFGQTLVRKYVSRAQRGFQNNQLIDNVVKFKNALRPGLLEELAAMQSAACRLE
jgi:HEXXH motif-containing protein